MVTLDETPRRSVDALELAPHVVMVVANDVSSDTRVRKMAHDLAAAGPRVTVLGISATGRREELRIGSAAVVRLPVAHLLRGRRSRWATYMNRHQVSQAITLGKQKFFSYQRDAGASIAWLRADYFRARTQRNQVANQRASEHRARQEERNRVRLARSEATLLWRSESLGRLARTLMLLLSRADAGRGGITRKWRRSRGARNEARKEAVFRRAERRIQRRLERRHRLFNRRQERLTKVSARITENGDKADWRRVLSELHDYEAAFGPALDSLRTNVIHAQDLHLLGVAARAVSRARAAGFDTKLIYDAHEYIQGLAHPRPVLAWSSLEREYIARADSVITVAPAIAQLLAKDYGLDMAPTVIMNIPAAGSETTKSVRGEAGVGASETLLVYSGGLDATRGVHTLVKALGIIEDAHLVLVSKATTGYTIELERIAEDGGFADRLHFAPFVEPQHVVGYLESATIGVHTIVSGPINHEVTLPNKIFEYMHARLPIVVSNCKAMSEFVAELGIGRAFVSEDVDSLAEAISDVIARRDDYRAVYEERPEILETYSWRSERRKLFGVYRDLLGEHAVPADIEHEQLAPLVDLKD